jgi:hypothetical protein
MVSKHHPPDTVPVQNETLPPRTVVTNKSWSPSLSVSAKAAATLIRPGSANPGLGSDVSEFASTHVLPQFVATHLVHEVNVVASATATALPWS